MWLPIDYHRSSTVMVIKMIPTVMPSSPNWRWVFILLTSPRSFSPRCSFLQFVRSKWQLGQEGVWYLGCQLLTWHTARESPWSFSYINNASLEPLTFGCVGTVGSLCSEGRGSCWDKQERILLTGLHLIQPGEQLLHAWGGVRKLQWRGRAGEDAGGRLDTQGWLWMVQPPFPTQSWEFWVQKAL